MEGTRDQPLERDLVCELAEMSESGAMPAVLLALARRHWSAVMVLPAEVVGRLQRQGGPALDRSMRHLGEWAGVAVPSRLGIAGPVGRLPAECSSKMEAAHRSCSYGPCPASEDALVSYCSEAAKTHCPHHLVLVEEGLVEACW